MELQKLISIASSGYPDDLIMMAYTADKSLDGLASFISNELKDTYDVGEEADEEQLTEAIRVMETARAELDGVILALNTAKANLDK